MTTRKCAGCPESFVPVISRHYYCSVKCRERFAWLRWKAEHPNRTRRSYKMTTEEQLESARAAARRYYHKTKDATREKRKAAHKLWYQQLTPERRARLKILALESWERRKDITREHRNRRARENRQRWTPAQFARKQALANERARFITNAAAAYRRLMGWPPVVRNERRDARFPRLMDEAAAYQLLMKGITP